MISGLLFLLRSFSNIITGIILTSSIHEAVLCKYVWCKKVFIYLPMSSQYAKHHLLTILPVLKRQGCHKLFPDGNSFGICVPHNYFFLLMYILLCFFCYRLLNFWGMQQQKTIITVLLFNKNFSWLFCHTFYPCKLWNQCVVFHKKVFWFVDWYHIEDIHRKKLFIMTRP